MCHIFSGPAGLAVHARTSGSKWRRGIISEREFFPFPPGSIVVMTLLLPEGFSPVSATIQCGRYKLPKAHLPDVFLRVSGRLRASLLLSSWHESPARNYDIFFAAKTGKSERASQLSRQICGVTERAEDEP